MKRIFLFLMVNILVIATLSISWSILSRFFGLGHYLDQSGLDYRSLMALCFFWGMAGSFISLFLSKFMAKRLMGVQEIDGNAPQGLQFVLNMTHDLARRAGIRKMPEVGYYESPDMNAFATGPSKNNSLVAVSTGLINNMSRDEVEAVLAHEISHIKNGDMVTMTLLQGVINAFTMFLARAAAYFIMRRGNEDENVGGFSYYILVFVLDILFSILGSFVTAAFSRAREFRADSGASRLTSSESMINALRALDRHYNPAYEDSSEKSVATLKISGGRGILSLLSTHPPIEKRIEHLKKRF